jgi:hypothetical protein
MTGDRLFSHVKKPNTLGHESQIKVGVYGCVGAFSATKGDCDILSFNVLARLTWNWIASIRCVISLPTVLKMLESDSDALPMKNAKFNSSITSK